MRKLTKTERAQVLKAAEFIADCGGFSCIQLRRAGASIELRNKYADMFRGGEHRASAWLVCRTLDLSPDECKELRVLLLLLFLEVHS